MKNEINWVYLRDFKGLGVSQDPHKKDYGIWVLEHYHLRFRQLRNPLVRESLEEYFCVLRCLRTARCFFFLFWFLCRSTKMKCQPPSDMISLILLPGIQLFVHWSH